jgi:puromycin-sensitive aminopeptidase
MCFPCWDEPDLKATFGVTVVAAGADGALQRAGDRTYLPARCRVQVRFADTMIMSTYLVCVIVGRLAGDRAVGRARRCRSGSHAAPGRSTSPASRVEVGVFALDWFADYYDIAYPEAKLDQAAIPDFAQGAMENTGW